MTRQLISSGSTFEEQIGYSRAVAAGDWVFVSDTTGFDYTSMTIPDGLVEQTEQSFKNIESALQQAGSSLRDVVRVTYVLPEASEFERCWPRTAKILRKRAPGSDDDRGGPSGSADEDRNRSNGPEARVSRHR